MAALIAPLLWWILISVCFSLTSADQRNITVGQNITLPCRAAGNKPVIVVKWSRPDLGKKHVLLYRDDQIDPFNQDPSYKNRVNLQDREMKDGDVSLVLNNGTINDTGRYECRVQIEGTLDTNLIGIIYLNVLPPGNKDESDQDGSTGLIVGLILFVVLVLVAAGVLFLIYRKQSACFRKKNPDPPVDL